jgi:hypothetical protein
MGPATVPVSESRPPEKRQDGHRWPLRTSAAVYLQQYRVDNDPAVSIPIDDIQSGIRRAHVCLADITLDNPNVWFELGYALASDKEMCLVCSEERTEKYPFDVQHRTITKYRVESKSDFDSLQSKITERLKAIMDKSSTLAIIEAQSPIKEPDGLLQHEMIVLASIVENRQGVGDSVGHGILREELERMGYNNLALNIGLEGFLERGMIARDEVEEYPNNFNEAYKLTVYYVRPEGMKWILRNYERLNLKVGTRQEKQAKIINDLDDNITF